MNFIILNEHAYLLLIDKNLNKKSFVLNAKVKEGTYAFILVERIYDMIFSELIDLKKEFDNYYCNEYSSFPVFLKKHYNLDEKLIDYIVSQNRKDVFIGSTSATVDGLKWLIYNAEGEHHKDIIKIIDSLMEVSENEN